LFFQGSPILINDGFKYNCYFIIAKIQVNFSNYKIL
jgi:hypothetical protein